MTLTFDLENLIRSSVGASEHSPSVLTELFKPFMSSVVTVTETAAET